MQVVSDSVSSVVHSAPLLTCNVLPGYSSKCNESLFGAVSNPAGCSGTKFLGVLGFGIFVFAEQRSFAHTDRGEGQTDWLGTKTKSTPVFTKLI